MKQKTFGFILAGAILALNLLIWAIVMIFKSNFLIPLIITIVIVLPLGILYIIKMKRKVIEVMEDERSKKITYIAGFYTYIGFLCVASIISSILLILYFYYKPNKIFFTAGITMSSTLQLIAIIYAISYLIVRRKYT